MQEALETVKERVQQRDLKEVGLRRAIEELYPLVADVLDGEEGALPSLIVASRFCIQLGKATEAMQVSSQLVKLTESEGEGYGIYVTSADEAVKIVHGDYGTLTNDRFEGGYLGSKSGHFRMQRRTRILYRSDEALREYIERHTERTENVKRGIVVDCSFKW